MEQLEPAVSVPEDSRGRRDEDLIPRVEVPDPELGKPLFRARGGEPSVVLDHDPGSVAPGDEPSVRVLRHMVRVVEGQPVRVPRIEGAKPNSVETDEAVGGPEP